MKTTTPRLTSESKVSLSPHSISAHRYVVYERTAIRLDYYNSVRFVFSLECCVYSVTVDIGPRHYYCQYLLLSAVATTVLFLASPLSFCFFLC